MPKKSEPYKVGDHVQISLNNQIMDAVIRAVIDHTDGLRLQVDFGHEQTALIYEWRVVRNDCIPAQNIIPPDRQASLIVLWLL
jgi:hypothetical protein